jgi:FkbM family methyltransferase
MNENLKLFNKGGFKYFLSTNHNSCIDRDIIRNGCWEPNATKLVKNTVKKGDVVIDVGANIGYFTLLFSKLVGDVGKVISFEPFNYFYDRLISNIELNKLRNVVAINKGVYSKRKKCLFKRGFPSTAIVDLIKKDDDLNRYCKSEVVSFDDWFFYSCLNRLDFIKIDVDGTEFEILEGAQETIDLFRPVLLVEFGCGNAVKIGEKLWSMGYVLYDEKTGKEVGLKKLTKIDKSNLNPNLLAKGG